MTRPRSVTVAGLAFAAAGVAGLLYHAMEFTRGATQYELYWVLVLRILAITGGVLLLRGVAWARWLTLAWLGYHVVLSAFHSTSEAVTHLILLAVFAVVLFRPGASGYFRARGDLRRRLDA